MLIHRPILLRGRIPILPRSIIDETYNTGLQYGTVIPQSDWQSTLQTAPQPSNVQQVVLPPINQNGFDYLHTQVEMMLYNSGQALLNGGNTAVIRGKAVVVGNKAPRATALQHNVSTTFLPWPPFKEQFCFYSQWVGLYTSVMALAIVSAPPVGVGLGIFGVGLVIISLAVDC